MLSDVGYRSSNKNLLNPVSTNRSKTVPLLLETTATSTIIVENYNGEASWHFYSDMSNSVAERDNRRGVHRNYLKHYRINDRKIIVDNNAKDKDVNTWKIIIVFLFVILLIVLISRTKCCALRCGENESQVQIVQIKQKINRKNSDEKSLEIWI